MEDLQKIILALLGIAIVLLFVMQFVPFLDEIGSRTSCKNWVNMQSKSKIAGVKIPSLFESPCLTFSSKIETDTKEKIYKHLANSMYDCWSMYGGGKIDFYSDWDFGSSDTHCLVCEEIQVNKEIDTSIDIDKFEEYLSNYNPPSHEETYAEYFLGPDYSSIDFGTGTIQINNKNSLYTIFVINKQGSIPPETIFENSAILAGCLGVGKIGAIAGTFIPIPGFSTAVGAIGGCAIGIIGSTTIISTSHKEYLYPSIFLASGEDVLEKGCDEEIYYKPKGSSNTEINKIGKS